MDAGKSVFFPVASAEENSQENDLTRSATIAINRRGVHFLKDDPYALVASAGLHEVPAPPPHLLLDSREFELLATMQTAAHWMEFWKAVIPRNVTSGSAKVHSRTCKLGKKK